MCLFKRCAEIVLTILKKMRPNQISIFSFRNALKKEQLKKQQASPEDQQPVPAAPSAIVQTQDGEVSVEANTSSGTGFEIKQSAEIAFLRVSDIKTIKR